MEAVNPQESSTKEVLRSTSFPNYDLSEIIPFVTKIYVDLGYSQFHDKDSIAKVHGSAYSTIKQRLSTATQYNLLEIKYGAGYKVTPLFIKLYKPVDDDEKRAAIMEALQSSFLYGKLIDQYQGHILPSKVGLATILFRHHGVIEKSADRAAEIFILNLEKYGFLTQDRFLNFSSTSSTNAVPPSNITNQSEVEFIPIKDNDNKDSIEQVKALPSPVINPEIIQSEMIEIPIPLKSGKRAFLKIPENIQAEDLDRISKFVDALK